MQDIKIIPIFNQAAPRVWHDFARICASTMQTNYNHKMSDDEIADQQAGDAKMWCRPGLKFAFGAYDGSEMVGFIRGKKSGRVAMIESLYVLKLYQGMHVGRRLLTLAESAMSFFVSQTELIALQHARPFYEAHGYKSLRENRYVKNLDGLPHCENIPVFSCNAALTKQCRTLDTEFDAGAVNAAHAPMYVYFDVDARVRGYILKNRDAEPVLRINDTGCAGIVNKSLIGSMSRYLALQQNIKQR